MSQLRCTYAPKFDILSNVDGVTPTEVLWLFHHRYMFHTRHRIRGAYEVL